MPPAQDRRFRLTEGDAQRCAATYGTPTYVIDEVTFRDRCRSFLGAARAASNRAEVSYASKANPISALMAIAYSEGLGIDVASEGELRAALKAGVPASACHLHGNNKSGEELAFALEVGIGKIMVDHFGEIEMLADGCKTEVVLRLAPGVDPITHAKISTGQSDTKFGFNIADGSALKAVMRCRELGLNLVGFHCHVGSQLLDPEAQRAGGEQLAQFAQQVGGIGYLNVGGGLGISYSDSDEPMGFDDYCRLVTEAVHAVGIDPIVGHEPGRSLIGDSGVTLYQVGVMKTVPIDGGTRTYVAVDGGLADNPRPALYGSRYPVERVGGGTGSQRVSVSGRHCETDLLFPDISLPEDLAEGDLLQILCTGAYNSAMASNYNRYRRPPTVLRRADGTFATIQRTESWDELLARDLLPEDLLLSS